MRFLSQRFIQSPLGLVPKDNGKQTRLIFHLSYDFGIEDDKKSVNFHTPDEICTVQYRDLDHAIRTCLALIKQMCLRQDLRRNGTEMMATRMLHPFTFRRVT